MGDEYPGLKVAACTNAPSISIQERLNSFYEVRGRTLIHVFAKIQRFSQLVFKTEHLEKQRTQFIDIETPTDDAVFLAFSARRSMRGGFANGIRSIV